MGGPAGGDPACTKLSLRPEQLGCPPPLRVSTPGGSQPCHGGACVWLSPAPWSCSGGVPALGRSLLRGPAPWGSLLHGPALGGVPAPWSCSIGVPALWSYTVAPQGHHPPWGCRHMPQASKPPPSLCSLLATGFWGGLLGPPSSPSAINSDAAPVSQGAEGSHPTLSIPPGSAPTLGHPLQVLVRACDRAGGPSVGGSHCG